jgi:hypothetical protein
LFFGLFVFDKAFSGNTTAPRVLRVHRKREETPAKVLILSIRFVTFDYLIIQISSKKHTRDHGVKIMEIN